MSQSFFFLSEILYFNLLIWSYLLFFWGRAFLSNEPLFWSNQIFFRSSQFSQKSTNDNVVIIIPARNEQNTIKETLKSVINQTEVSSNIIVVDDNSEDLTVRNALAAFESEKFTNFKIIQGKKLKPGWSGKVWALYQGTESVRKKTNFNYFLFLDSDIVLKKNTVSSMISKIKKEKLYMLSLMAKLNCESMWEKMLIPTFIYFFKKLYPFNEVNKFSSKISGAAGGCILCRSILFKKTNLFKIIKQKVIDDCNLAREIKKKGPIWLGLTTDIKSIRKYNSLSEIWETVSRTAYEQLDNRLLFLFLASFFMILIYLLAPLCVIIFFLNNNFTYPNLILSFITTSMMYISFIPTAKFYKISFLYFSLLPITSFLYLIMTINSAFNYYFFRGNIWKDRKYQ